MANPLLDKFILAPTTARRLGGAERAIGQLLVLRRVWPQWPEFSANCLAALSARDETLALGHQVDLFELLSLGPQPEPSRPNQSLRWACGLTLAYRRMEQLQDEDPLTPGMVTELVHNLDAPFLARGFNEAGDPPPMADGASVWTLAPRLLESGVPALIVAGFTLASWEREGPDHDHRRPAGRVLLSGLAPQLDLPHEAFYGLGPALATASSKLGGLKKLLRDLRVTGVWQLWQEVFLAAVAGTASRNAELGLRVREIMLEHQDLVETWVRAPKQPKRLIELLAAQPIIDLPAVADALEVTQRTAGLLIQKLQDLSLVAELTGKKRGRKYAYTAVMELLAPAEMAALANGDGQ